MSKHEENISCFTSTNKHHLYGTKYVYFVTNYVDRKNDNSMVGTKAMINGKKYLVEGVETFALVNIQRGQRIGILIDESKEL